MRFRSMFSIFVALLALAWSVHTLAQDHAQTAQPAADAAHAVSDEHAQSGSANPMQFNIVPFISALVVFGTVFLVLRQKVWPTIIKGLDDREEKIRTEITDAEQARVDAQSALAEYQKSLADARNEAGKIIEQAKIDQQRVAAELKSKTESELNQMRDAAKRDIEHAKKQAVSEIYSHMATLATDVASKILDKELSASDQQKLVEESLNQLQPVGAGA